ASTYPKPPFPALARRGRLYCIGAEALQAAGETLWSCRNSTTFSRIVDSAVEFARPAGADLSVRLFPPSTQRRNFMKRIAYGLAAVFILSSAALAAEPAKTMDTKAGKVYTDDKGMTLYTFDKDGKGVSNCYDTCAKNWPPFAAAADAK